MALNTPRGRRQERAGGMSGRNGQHIRRLGLVLGLLAVGACAPMYRNHGFAPSEAELAAVQVGVDTRESVAETIGPPTAGGVLDGTGFYYVESRFRTIGPLRPQEIDREVVAITFDGRGVVRNVERFGLEDGIVVALNRRVTDDKTRDTTFIRQLLGNIGRVNAGDMLGGG